MLMDTVDGVVTVREGWLIDDYKYSIPLLGC
jgi:hypothetical protein